ncbi:MAG: hypothetical protein HYU62_02130 [Caulobacterales bacterium]|nr:hypothetical protein [Caulobacterales bacterium]
MVKPILSAQFSKIARARTLLNDFQVEEQAYRGSLQLKLVEVPDETGLRHITIKAEETVPDNAALIAAEIVYHARSALDQMVVEIGRQNGINNTEHLYFPFTRSADEFGKKRAQDKMLGLPDDVKEMLARLEPYEDGNPRLWGIGTFANVDKHRMLIPVVAFGSGGELSGVDFNSGRHPGSTGIVLGGPANLNEGLVISKIGPDGYIRIRGRIGVRVQIVFGDVPAFSGREAVPTLNSLIDLSESILKSFSAHCFGQ